MSFILTRLKKYAESLFCIKIVSEILAPYGTDLVFITTEEASLGRKSKFEGFGSLHFAMNLHQSKGA